MLERLFEEVKRRTRVVGAFPNESNAATLATEIALRIGRSDATSRWRPSKQETKPRTFETLTKTMDLESREKGIVGVVNAKLA
jgi:transposase-like protein